MLLYGTMIIKAFAQCSAFTGSIIAVNAAPSQVCACLCVIEVCTGTAQDETAAQSLQAHAASHAAPTLANELTI